MCDPLRWGQGGRGGPWRLFATELGMVLEGLIWRLGEMGEDLELVSLSPQPVHLEWSQVLVLEAG